MLGRQLEGVPPYLLEKVAPACERHQVRWGHHHLRKTHDLSPDHLYHLCLGWHGEGYSAVGEASPPEVLMEMLPTVVVLLPLLLPPPPHPPLLLLLLRKETKGGTFATSTFATAFALGLLVVEGRLASLADRSACTEISSACLADSIAASASTPVVKPAAEDWDTRRCVAFSKRSQRG